MNKKILFGILVIVQLVAPAWVVYSSQAIMTKGEVFKFRTAPVDPYDAFRGRYVAVSMMQQFVEPSERTNFFRNQKVFLILEKDAQGFVSLIDAVTKRPRKGDYLEVRVNYHQTTEYEYFKNDQGKNESRKKPVNKLHFRSPFRRFYMNEKKAPEAEKIYRESSRREKQEAYLRVRVLNGKGLIEDLYVQDKPILEHFPSKAQVQDVSRP